MRARAKKKGAPLRVLTSDGTASWDRQLIDPAIIELALTLRMPVEIPKGDPGSYTFWLWDWVQRSGNPLDELVRVGKHPFFGKVLVSSFMPTRETKDEVGKWLERAVRCKGFDGVLAALDAFGATLAETWTLGALKVHEPWIEGLCQPAVLARCPALARAIRELDTARLLRNQLRAGIMDEWGWPEREEALALFPKDRQHSAAETVTGPLPYGVLFDDEASRIVAYGPGGIALDRKIPKKKRDVRGLFFSQGDVLVYEYKPERAWWLSDGKAFKSGCNGFYEIACDGDLITRGDHVLPAGDHKYKGRPKGDQGGSRAWFDGNVFSAVAQEAVLRANGTSVKGRPDDYYTFDPKTANARATSYPRGWRGSSARTARSSSTFRRASSVLSRRARKPRRSARRMVWVGLRSSHATAPSSPKASTGAERQGS